MNPLGISFAITTHNETLELEILLDRLNKYKDESDEVVIVDDYSTEPHTLEILDKVQSVHKRRLNKNYAKQKNYLNSKCTKNYIFQIDADELPTQTLLFNLKAILKENINIDLMWVPRKNTVDGILEKHIQMWNWKIDKEGKVNYPDYQGRIYKNKKEIHWTRAVHEYIQGYTSSSKLPIDLDLELLHPKTIDKQIKNNLIYSNNYNSDGTPK